MTDQPYDAELRNWQIFDSTWGGQVALGYIYNDGKGRFDDGTFVRTTTVASVEDGILTTRNTRYKLVDPAGGGTVCLPS